MFVKNHGELGLKKSIKPHSKYGIKEETKPKIDKVDQKVTIKWKYQ